MIALLFGPLVSPMQTGLEFLPPLREGGSSPTNYFPACTGRTARGAPLAKRSP